ncbi:OTU domain-containing protein [Rhodotorula paludigena]|uniref:OTU domain-containing protein n=1 Tax=Rhodotorula paludigena TaxID=86838 RepID=UPI003180282E
MAKGAGKGKGGHKVYGKARDRTRSDRPKLIEDPQEEERVLTAQLREAGLYAANILGDGNCLFRALSDQLYGSPSMHLAIRNEICDYLASHPDKYRLFVDEDSVKGGFEGHVREMRQPGTYGTNIELSAFVARYRRPVKVYQPNLVYVLPVEDQSPSAPSGSASTSSSPPPPPPPPPPHGAEDTTLLTPRERRARAREEKARKKEEKHRERVAASRGAQMKGKGREEEVEEAQAAEEDEQEEEEAEQPDGGREAARADEAPLCIVYHSWEHYSSLRNLSGPHTGPPRLRVGRVGTPQAADPIEPSRPEEQDENEDEPDEDTDMADEAVVAAHDSEQATRLRRSDRPAAPPTHTLPAPNIPVLPPSDSSASPSSPPSSPPRPSSSRKHRLDESLTLERPRSPAADSSSSAAPSPPSTAFDGSLAPSATARSQAAAPRRRVRSRLASPASDAPSTSSSSSSTGSSTGVASSYSESSTRASSAPPLLPPVSSSSSPPPASSFARARKAAPPPPPLRPQRERRGPTMREKKDLGRARRLERRRAKGVAVQPVVERPRRKGKEGVDDSEGRVLRSGRGSKKEAGDAGLGGKVRELYI